MPKKPTGLSYNTLTRSNDKLYSLPAGASNRRTDARIQGHQKDLNNCPSEPGRQNSPEQRLIKRANTSTPSTPSRNNLHSQTKHPAYHQIPQYPNRNPTPSPPLHPTGHPHRTTCAYCLCVRPAGRPPNTLLTQTLGYTAVPRKIRKYAVRVALRFPRSRL